MNRNKKIVKTMAAAAMAGVLAIQAGAYPVFAEEKAVITDCLPTNMIATDSFSFC